MNPISKESFPKQCPTCKKIYYTEFEFFTKTTPVTMSRHDIKEISDDDDIYLEIYRNCDCGSTLMEFFSSRRDLSEQGIRKRTIFGELLLALDKAGYEKADSRSLLLEFMLLSKQP